MNLNKSTLVTFLILLNTSWAALAFDVNERAASELAKKKFKAQKLLKVESISSRGTKAFKIKMLLNSGRLKTVFVDKKSGKISERQP